MDLVYNPDKNPLGKSLSFSMAKVLLKAGINSLSDSQMDAIKQHPDYAKFTELGAFSLEADKEKTPKRTTRKKQSPILLEMPN